MIEFIEKYPIIMVPVVSGICAIACIGSLAVAAKYISSEKESVVNIMMATLFIIVGISMPCIIIWFMAKLMPLV